MFTKIYRAGIALAALALIASGSYTMWQARAQVGVLFPQVTGVTATNSVTTIVAANPSRHYIEICNVGATNDVWIAPSTLGTTTAVTVAALGAGSFLLSRNSAAGANVVNNCYKSPVFQFAGAGAGSAWTAITNASTSPVTIYEY